MCFSSFTRLYHIWMSHNISWLYLIISLYCIILWYVSNVEHPIIIIISHKSNFVSLYTLLLSSIPIDWALWIQCVPKWHHLSVTTRLESGALLTQHFAVWEPDTQKQTLILDIRIPMDFSFEIAGFKGQWWLYATWTLFAYVYVMKWDPLLGGSKKQNKCCWSIWMDFSYYSMK